ncbi:unnamed protein product [Caenorhabditis bovis]|uniref:G-protein coupled receptors family 1 profile domain-containing protein n=1 Tax=Caenorhabditis bovis TaxID=2654633 RepID=A0A8S1EF68_9PELO|nr:unnamed protein product [Caenorhabditis bovis]
MIWHWSDTLNIFYSFPIAFLSIIFNILLIYIVAKYSPMAMKSYSILIISEAIYDIFVAFCLSMVIPRFRNSGFSIVIIFHGPCQLFFSDRYIQSNFCLFFECGAIYAIFGIQLIVFYSLYFRQQSVLDPFKVFRRSVILTYVLILSAFNAIMTVVTFVQNLYPIEVSDAVAEKLKPGIVKSGWPFGTVVDMFQISQIPPNALTNILNPTVVVYGILCRYRVNKAVRNDTHMSEQMKHLHRGLANVLFAQVFSSAVAFFTCVLYMVSLYYDVEQSTLSENTMFFPAILMLLVSPIVTIYFVRPYRNKIIEIFHFPFLVNSAVNSVDITGA